MGRAIPYFLFLLNFFKYKPEVGKFADTKWFVWISTGNILQCEFSLDNRTLFGRYYSKISQLRCITKQRGLLVSLYTRQLVVQRFNQIFKTLNDLHFESIFINVKQINFVIDGLFKKAIIFFLPLFSLSLFLFSVKGPANAEKGSATNNDCRFGLILRQLRPWTIVFGLYILQTIIRGNST